MMISVCMATKNGANYIAEQLDSILVQLKPGDEVIIADDKSTDETLAIIQSFKDSRIKIIQNNFKKGIPQTFETSLRASKGGFIFLADQDDVWNHSKLKVMTDHLKYCDLVISDCVIADHSLKIKNNSFFTLNNSGKGLIKNIFHNSYMGCCMAFNRKLLNRALPFPKDIPIHDFWIGLIGEVYFDVRFIPEALVCKRRHSSNATSTGQRSRASFPRKFVNRYHLIKNLILH